MINDNLKWWQTAVFYQIYPRSFADGNGDGIGDLKGMIARLDALQDLGINAVWLSPHYPSPQVDVGYDIASYVDVAPEYGTLDEFKRFLEEAHRRDIRVITDLVLNHTSDQHPWFIESRSSRDNPKRDWYLWRDGKNGGPPNNWWSTFGGRGWEPDPVTGQYYYHFFFKEQPDLNWRNPEVLEAMWNVVRFWLDMGVDGFRLDAIGTIFEDENLPDQEAGITLDEAHRAGRLARTAKERARVAVMWDKLFEYQHDLPGMHDLMRELREVVDEYDERVLVGETDDIAYYGSGSDELHLVFNFPLMRTRRLTPQWVRANQKLRLATIPAGAWPCNTLGNHDSPRVYSNFGDGSHNDQLARLHLAIVLFLKGTPFLYNGEEIGMSDYNILDPLRWRDPLSLRNYRLEMELMGKPEPEAVLQGARSGRDKNRTPYQWANRANGGFCPEDVEPWLPVNPDYQKGINYEQQVEDPGSLLNFYKTLLRVRRDTPALITGEYRPLEGVSEKVLAFYRETAEQRVLVAMNFSARAHKVSGLSQGKILFSNGGELKKDSLAPFEVRLIELE